MKHLICVEDNLESQLLVKSMLKRIYQVSCANSSTEFDRIIQDQVIDLILMDISIEGDEDGIQLTRRLRGMPEYKSIPIIALTAHAYRTDQQNAMEAGCDDFLTKPFKKAELLKRIQALLPS